MEASKVKDLITAGLAVSHVEVTDTTGTGDHFSAVVVSAVSYTHLTLPTIYSV